MVIALLCLQLGVKNRLIGANNCELRCVYYVVPGNRGNTVLLYCLWLTKRKIWLVGRNWKILCQSQIVLCERVSQILKALESVFPNDILIESLS